MIMRNRGGAGWPRTVDETVDRILAKLTEVDKDAIRETSAGDLHLLHFGLGTAIRNKFGLWRGNMALLAACGLPDMHPDDASHVIVRAVWERLRAAV
jgi:hypothetical protein